MSDLLDESMAASLIFYVQDTIGGATSSVLVSVQVLVVNIDGYIAVAIHVLSHSVHWCPDLALL